MRLSATRTFPRPFASSTLLAGALLLAAAVGCDRPPSATDLRDWTAADHDRIEDQQRIAQGGQPGAPRDPQQQAAELIDAMWRQQCASCHGVMGKGDGPNAAAFKPADLTREEWQASVTDEQIATAIKNGKGRMPKFENLPEPLLRGLVERIRFYRGK